MREGRFVAVGTFLKHMCPQLVVLANTRQGQLRVGAYVPSVRGETGCSLRVVQQSEVVGSCPGVQALTDRRCFALTPVEIWHFKSPTCRLGCGNIRMAVGASRESGGL